MVIGQRFPVCDKYFGKNIRFNFGIDFHTQIAGSIVGNLAYQSCSDVQTNHYRKRLDDCSGFMTGNNVYQISGYQAGYQAYDSAKHAKHCIKDHHHPVMSCVLVDPKRLLTHFLQASGLYAPNEKADVFF